MKHLLSVDSLAPGVPVHVFGAGTGGALISKQLEDAGHRVAAFIDDTKAPGGSIGIVPVLSTQSFAANMPAGAVVLIASQHWRAIGRVLKNVLAAELIDASPLIREAVRRVWRRIPDRELDGVVSAAILDSLPQDPAIDHLYARVGPLPCGPVACYIHGADARALRLRDMLRQSRLEPVGFVDDGKAGGFIDYIDVCGFDDFVADERGNDPLILVSDAQGADAFRSHGFSRVVEVSVAEADARPRPLAQADPDESPFSIVRLDKARQPGESFGAALLRQLRQCRGAIIALHGAEGAPSAQVLAKAQEYFTRDPGMAALIPSAEAGTFDLTEFLFGAHSPGFPLRFLRRQALVDVGVYEDGWHVPAFAMELCCRLATDHRVALMPGLDSPHRAADFMAEPDMADAAIVLNRLCSGDGFFGADKRLLRYGKARLVAREAGHPLPPLVPEIYNAVAQRYDDRGQIEQALATWDAGSGFHDPNTDSLAAQALLKSPAATMADQLARQREWARRHAPVPDRPMECRIGDGPIRVGYICAFAQASYFTYQVLPFVAKHDRTQFAVTCYVDTTTPALATAADTVREVAHLGDQAFAEQVRADGIHILVEVTGFSPGHRYGAMALRAAPVQISYINHMGSCAVPNVDWFIGDAVATPPESEPFFSERIYRVPGSFFCFDYSADSGFPAILPPPVLDRGYVTLGCFGSGSKFNDRLIALWSQVLKAIPTARLALCNGSLASAANRAFMLRRFAKNGIAPERLVLHPGSDRAGALKLYQQVDISLDTWPYCGGNTIAESVMMGVPVISLTGETTASRYGASLLAASGCAELIAHSPAEYVAKAAALAADTDALCRYRGSLRQSMHTCGFGDSARFVRILERAYKEMIG